MELELEFLSTTATFSKPDVMRNKWVMSLGMEILVRKWIKSTENSVEKSEGKRLSEEIVIYVCKRKYLQSTDIIILTFFSLNFWDEYL